MLRGLGDFTQNANFVCLSQACYGKDYVPGVTPLRRVGAVFLELQQVANRAALKYGLPTIDEDELIGNSTANLINQIAQRSNVGALAFAPYSMAKASIMALELIEAIKTLIAPGLVPPPPLPGSIPSAPSLPFDIPLPVTTPGPTAPTAPTPPKVTTTYTASGVALVPARTKAIFAVVGSAAVIGVGIAVIAVVKSRKGRTRQGVH